MSKVYAHKLVAKVAREMAGAIYDECAKLNEWYALNPSRKNFVARVASDMVQNAVDALAELLGRSDVPEDEKLEIFEALLKHKALPQKQSGPFARTSIH